MISKELLSEVMPEAQITKDSEIIIDYFFSERIEYVNIYELAHKCKEWAFEFNYNLCSSKRKNGSWECWTVFDDNSDNLIGYFESDSEPEAIFQACQWILDNKDEPK